MDCHGPVIFELLPSVAVLEGFGSVENRQHTVHKVWGLRNILIVYILDLVLQRGVKLM